MNGGAGSGNTPRRIIIIGGIAMYVIYNRDEGMYLAGTQNRGLGVLTCVWSIDRQDAMLFDTALAARQLLRRIGTYDAVVKRVRASGDGV